MIAFTINAEKNYVLISIEGKPLLEDYVNATDVLARNDEVHPCMHRVVDFTRGELDVSGEEVAHFADETRKLPIESSTRTALVGKTDEERQLLDIFAGSFDTGEFRVFPDSEPALAWVRDGPGDVSLVPADRIRVHRLLGDVTEADVLRFQKAWFADADFDDETPILWDLRKARLRIDVEDLVALAEKMQNRSIRNRPTGRAAVLVGSKLHETVLKLGFQKGISRGRLRFFYGEPAAVEFLLTD